MFLKSPANIVRIISVIANQRRPVGGEKCVLQPPEIARRPMRTVLLVRVLKPRRLLRIVRRGRNNHIPATPGAALKECFAIIKLKMFEYVDN